VFHISSILYCIFILCITVTNLALWLQDLNKLTYLITRECKRKLTEDPWRDLDM